MAARAVRNTSPPIGSNTASRCTSPPQPVAIDAVRPWRSHSASASAPSGLACCFQYSTTLTASANHGCGRRRPALFRRRRSRRPATAGCIRRPDRHDHPRSHRPHRPERWRASWPACGPATPAGHTNRAGGPSHEPGAHQQSVSRCRPTPCGHPSGRSPDTTAPPHGSTTRRARRPPHAARRRPTPPSPNAASASSASRSSMRAPVPMRERYRTGVTFMPMYQHVHPPSVTNDTIRPETTDTRPRAAHTIVRSRARPPAMRTAPMRYSCSVIVQLCVDRSARREAT